MNTTGLSARIRRALTTPAAVPETGPKLKTNLDTDLLKLIAIAAKIGRASCRERVFWWG